MPLVKTEDGEFKEFPYNPQGVKLAQEFIEKNEGSRIVSKMDKMKYESRKGRREEKKEKKKKMKMRNS